MRLNQISFGILDKIKENDRKNLHTFEFARQLYCSQAESRLFSELDYVNIRELLWLVHVNIIYYFWHFLRNRVKIEPNCLETP